MAAQFFDSAVQPADTASWLHEPAPKAMLERMQDVTQKKHFEDPDELELAAAKTLAWEYEYFLDVLDTSPDKLPTFQVLCQRFSNQGNLLGLASPRLTMWEARKAWNFMMEALAAGEHEELGHDATPSSSTSASEWAS